MHPHSPGSRVKGQRKWSPHSEINHSSRRGTHASPELPPTEGNPRSAHGPRSISRPRQRRRRRRRWEYYTTRLVPRAPLLSHPPLLASSAALRTLASPRSFLNSLSRVDILTMNILQLGTGGSSGKLAYFCGYGLSALHPRLGPPRSSKIILYSISLLLPRLIPAPNPGSPSPSPTCLRGCLAASESPQGHLHPTSPGDLSREKPQLHRRASPGLFLAANGAEATSRGDVTLEDAPLARVLFFALFRAKF
uniref:Uncharacterized protein n=1 Tax=Steinernema glaseri TaxID=37863 RepID=A0A1I8AC08_9BILA